MTYEIKKIAAAYPYFLKACKKIKNVFTVIMLFIHVNSFKKGREPEGSTPFSNKHNYYF